LLL
ncbi:metallo-beta-lactamase superfamily protein, partial [Chlamydia psittaci 84-8471/1]|jgi:hypothetical protein